MGGLGCGVSGRGPSCCAYTAATCFGVLAVLCSIGTAGKGADLAQRGLPQSAAVQPTPNASSGQCPCSCKQAPHDDWETLATDVGACVPGRTCAYGKGWCREVSHASTSMEVFGTCAMEACSGPAGLQVYPTSTCSSPNVPSVNVLKIVRTVPHYIYEALQDIDEVNRLLRDVMAYQSLDGLTVEVDEALTSNFELVFEEAAATWLVGCWPPQRYAVVTGVARLPRGTMYLTIDGIRVAVSFSDFEFRFEQLRAEIQCHGGNFVVGRMGSEDGHAAMREDSLSVIGGTLTVGCAYGWEPWCLPLWLSRPTVSENALAAVRPVAAYFLGEARNVPAGSGCPSLLHNTMSIYPYASKECCEASYSTDLTGCLNGGQFSGNVPGIEDSATVVECEMSMAADTYAARCEQVPGGYFRTSEGACREDDNAPPPWKCSWCVDELALVRSALFYLKAGALSFLLAAVCSVAGCLLSRGCHQARVQRFSRVNCDE